MLLLNKELCRGVAKKPLWGTREIGSQKEGNEKFTFTLARKYFVKTA